MSLIRMVNFLVDPTAKLAVAVANKKISVRHFGLSLVPYLYCVLQCSSRKGMYALPYQTVLCNV